MSTSYHAPGRVAVIRPFPKAPVRDPDIPRPLPHSPENDKVKARAWVFTMQIVAQTPTLLQVRSSIGWLGLLFGIPFTLAGWGILTSFGKLSTLTCVQRDPVPCTLRQSNFLGSRTVAIESLRGAEVEESDSEESTTYRVVLLTEQGRIGLTGYSSSGYDRKRQQRDAINRFVGSPQRLLEVRQDDRLLGYVFGGTFFAVGLGGLASMFTSTTATFDKSRGKFFLRQVSLWEHRESDYPLSQVQHIDLEKKWDSDGDPTYRLAAILQSGERLPLSVALQFLGRRQQQEKMAMMIRQFLGLGEP